MRCDASKDIEPIIICDIFYTGCAAEDSFQNLHEFNAGFAQRLLLKDEAVPTLKAEAAVYGPQPVSMFYFFIKLFLGHKQRPTRFGFASQLAKFYCILLQQTPTNFYVHRQTVVHVIN